jgi:hypothetical protein
MKKVQDDVIIESYKILKNVWAVGKEVGMSGQQVHFRCSKLGIIEKKSHYKWQKDFILKNYEYYANRYMLKELAEIIDIDKSNLVRLAKK